MCKCVDMYVCVQVLCHLAVAIYRDAPNAMLNRKHCVVVCLIHFVLLDLKRTRYKLKQTHTHTRINIYQMIMQMDGVFHRLSPMAKENSLNSLVW